MKIYTKQGDDGSTGLFNGARVSKDHLRIEAYGTVDELNCHLGVANCHCKHPELSTRLLELQYQLFDLGADLATPVNAANEKRINRISESHVALVETMIDHATAQLPPLKRFILPGGGATASALHVARTVCRRAERLVVSLQQAEALTPAILIYLNRLSDLLFTLARLANQLDGIPDMEWIAKKE